MSREGIRDELHTRNILPEEMIYSGPRVSVYKGHYSDFPCAIKVLHAVAASDFAKYESEFRIVTRMTHPQIVKLYDFFSVEKQGRHFVVFVSEWFSKDLAKDASDRKRNQFMWTEEELWDVLRKLVSCLAYMQSLSIAHRDIKPNNIFYSQKEVKIGDFGCSVLHENQSAYSSTVVGTLQYFSPTLREAFSRNQFKVVHNMFKSDAYSLGLTMLHIALLDYPVLLNRVGITREETWSVIRSVAYSEGFQQTLLWLLEPDEVNRCDFTQIDNLLNLTRRPSEIVSEKFFLEEAKSSLAPIDDFSLKAEPSESEDFPACLNCQKSVYRANLQSAVRLPCIPERHMYCSASCFLVFAYSNQKSSLSCPMCGGEISREMWRQFVSGTEASLQSNHYRKMDDRLMSTGMTFKEHMKQKLSRRQTSSGIFPAPRQCGKFPCALM